MGVCVACTLCHVPLFATPWTEASRLLCPWNSPGNNTGVLYHFLPQGIFPTQDSNLCLLQWQVDSLSLRHLGNTDLKTDVYKMPNISVQSLSRVRLFVTPWTAPRWSTLSITNSRSLLKLMSIELVMSSNHLILCCPLLLLPSIFPSCNGKLTVTSQFFHSRWPKYWSFCFSMSFQ